MAVYFSLFSAAFLAATVLPLSSELLLGALLQLEYLPWLLWCAATAGNTLGAATNWVLGRFLLKYRERAWFPVKEEQLARGQKNFHKFGLWSLLFSWLPLGGDALTFIAGVMRVPFVVFILLTGIGKGARYAVLILLLQA